MASTDQFDYGEDLAPGLGARLTAGLVIAMFLISTFGTGIADTFFSVEGIKLVGEEAREQKQLERDVSVWNGTLARYYESKLRQHSRIRELVLPKYSYLKYVYLGEAPTAITIGGNRWMFLTARIKLRPLSEETLAISAANCVVALDRRLLGNGTELTSIPIPRKSWVARDLLPPGMDGRNAVDDRMIEALKNRGVTTVDMRDLFRSADPEEFYFKLDTHWTPKAARMTAEKAARVAGVLQPEAKRLGKLDTTPPQSGLLPGLATLRSIGIDPANYDLSTFNLRQPQMTRLHFKPKLRRWFRSPTPAVSWALAGTSFSEQQRMAQLISHYSGVAVFDGAERAQPFMNTAAEVLETYAGGEKKLEKLFWEIPIATIYNAFKGTGPLFGIPFGDAFQACPPDKQQLIFQIPESWLRFRLNEVQTLTKSRNVLFSIPAGVLAHSGDGVGALHIKGDVLDAALPTMLSNGSTSVNLYLEPGSFDVVLPILAEEPTSEAMDLAAGPRKKVRLRIDEVNLVHQPVGEQRIGLVPTRIASLVELKPPSPVLLGRRASLVVHTKRAHLPSRKLTVEIRVEGSKAAREVTFDQVMSGGVIVLDLGHEHGKRLTSIVLHAANGAPDISSAGIASGQL